MKRLIVISSAFIFFACQNKKNGDKNTIEKTSDKPAADSVHSINANKNADSTGFPEYWKDFRQAVLNADTNKLSSLTGFPIQTRGSLDSDPVIEYSKQQFPTVFNFYLKQWAGDEKGNTEFDIIKSTELPTNKVIHDQSRVGDMVFYLADKKWRLRFLYLNDDTIDSIKLTK